MADRDETSYSSGSYKIEMLKGNNWMPWKRRMLAVLRDLDLEEYVEESSKKPEPADRVSPTDDETKAIRKWEKEDAKARTRIELAIGDSEMVHILGANTAKEMWKQLTLVKESRGKMGILACRRALYRMIADEGFDLIEHISKMRKMQEELHLMGSKVSDEDFAMILVSSLPESWDLFTSAYLSTKSDGSSFTSHELVAILIEEDRRRRERTGDPRDVAMQARQQNWQTQNSSSRNNDSQIECHNCHKKGHMARDCWSKGGGKEGQGPGNRKRGGKFRNSQNRSNQSTETTDINIGLSDVAYMANTNTFSNYDWLLDSGTTTHICKNRNEISNYTALANTTISGLSKTKAIAEGRGTVTLSFSVNNQVVQHKLNDVLHVPEAPNSLLSVSRFDEIGGKVIHQDGKCELRSSTGQLIGTGRKINRLYLLDARAELGENNQANFAAPKKLTWDQWHRRYGHIGMTSLEKLQKGKLVDGLEVDESSVPSRSCEACIQAKQATMPFPKEAQNRSTIAGERTMSDVWGPARVESIGK
jgi:hypothetical protein